MSSFRDIPIKQKLTIIIMVITTTALLLCGAGIVASDPMPVSRVFTERDLQCAGRNHRR